MQVFGALDLSDAAHGHQLRAVEGVTANVQPKKWSLAGESSEPACLPAGGTPGAGSSHTRWLRAWGALCASSGMSGKKQCSHVCSPGQLRQVDTAVLYTGACVLLCVYVCMCVCRPD